MVGKGEIACMEQFLLFPQCFLFNEMIVSLFVHIFDVISLFAGEFEEPKIGISGKALKRVCMEEGLNLWKYIIYSDQLERCLFYKIQVNPIHTILKYGEYNDFMDRGWYSS